MIRVPKVGSSTVIDVYHSVLMTRPRRICVLRIATGHGGRDQSYKRADGYEIVQS